MTENIMERSLPVAKATKTTNFILSNMEESSNGNGNGINITNSDFLIDLLYQFRNFVEVISDFSFSTSNSSIPIMLTIEDVRGITGWSKRKVEQLFDDPNLNVVHIGKSKQVEASVLKQYLSQKHDPVNDRYWRSLSAREKAKSKNKAA